jgi:hypothetical protein
LPPIQKETFELISVLAEYFGDEAGDGGARAAAVVQVGISDKETKVALGAPWKRRGKAEQRDANIVKSGLDRKSLKSDQLAVLTRKKLFRTFHYFTAFTQKVHGAQSVSSVSLTPPAVPRALL